MNHNLNPAQPAASQPNPNVLANPNMASALPELNQSWETEAADRKKLREILSTANKLAMSQSQAGDMSELEKVQALLSDAQTKGNTPLIDHYTKEMTRLQQDKEQAERNRQVDRQKNIGSLLELVKGGNPSAIFTRLDRALTAAENEAGTFRKGAATARDKANKAAGRESDVDEEHARLRLHKSNNEPRSDEAKTAVDNALRHIGGEIGRAGLAAIKTEGEASSLEWNAEYIAHYPNEIRLLMEAVNEVYGKNWAECQKLNQDVAKDLRRWDVAAGPGANAKDLPQEVEKKLENFKTNIDELPRSDAARAEYLADFNRLHYRYMSRRIQLDLDENRQPSAEFTPNGGIRVKGENVVVYADSSVEIIDPVSGESKRKMPSGEDWHPVVKELDAKAETTTGSWQEAFATWEESRTHQDAKEAYAWLSRHKANIEPVETELSAELHEMYSRLMRNKDTINKLRGKPGVEAEIDRLIAENNALNADGPKVSQQLNELRAELNPIKYWLGFLELDAERKELQKVPSREQGFGRLLVSRHVKPVYKSVNVRSDHKLLPNGGIEFDPLTLNGRTVPSDAERENAIQNNKVLPRWRVWPNGVATRYDLRLDRTIIYGPEGYALERV